MITIWHNPRCGKSRDSKNLLDEKGCAYEVFDYLHTPLSVEKLKELMKMLGIADIREMLRTKEKEYKELAIEGKTQEEILSLVVQNPKLIERPIVIFNGKAAIGRPLENIEKLLGN